MTLVKLLAKNSTREMEHLPQGIEGFNGHAGRHKMNLSRDPLANILYPEPTAQRHPIGH